MSFLDRLRKLLGNSGSSGHHDEADAESCGSCRDISCMEALERIQEYLDGELGEMSHREVAHHFAVCKLCFPHLRLEERFRDLLHRSQMGELCPDHLRERIHRMLSAEADGST